MELKMENDDEIVAKVMHDQAVKAGEIVEIKSDEEDDVNQRTECPSFM